MRLMTRTLASAAFALSVTAAAAQPYVAGDVEYALSCNADGYVLTSKQEVTRLIPTPVDAEAISGIETIYLGRRCDAFHKIFGEGKWCRANGGFIAEFTAHSFGFGRQELTCPGAEAYQASCGCQ